MLFDPAAMFERTFLRLPVIFTGLTIFIYAGALMFQKACQIWRHIRYGEPLAPLWPYENPYLKPLPKRRNGRRYYRRRERRY
jgi:hypothetical protein